MFQPTLFEGTKRLVYDEAVEMTLASMQAYGPAHDHWVFAFSGGKDSTATLTVVIHLVDAGRLQAPKSISPDLAERLGGRRANGRHAHGCRLCRWLYPTASYVRCIMTNRFDFGSMPVKGGFLAFYRMVHHSKNFILRDGKLDRLFATAEEAELEAGKAFKEYLNSPISGMISTSEEKQSAGDALFPSLQPTVIKQKGKTRRVEVERRAIA